jgi:hypothetical protein
LRAVAVSNPPDIATRESIFKVKNINGMVEGKE